MTSKHILVAVGIALFALPAAGPAKTGEQKSGKAAVDDQKKYCLQYDNVVGSRVSRQECKTKSEWAKERVDIDKMLKE